MRISRLLSIVHKPVTALCAAGPAALSATPGTAAPKAKPSSAPVPAKVPVAVPKPDAVHLANPFLPPDFGAPDVDGTVLTLDGKPAMGAKVTWLSGDGNKDPLTAITDGEGRYHFDGKAAWTRKMAWARVSVEAEGFGWSGGNINMGPDFKHPSLLTIKLGPATQARVRLLTSAGKPAVGVAVVVDSLFLSGVGGDRRMISSPPPSDGSRRLSGADGVVTFPGLPQGWLAYLSIDDPAFAQLQFPQNQQKLSKAASTKWPDITLIPAATIDGTITTPDGKPAPGVAIEARTSGLPEKYGMAHSDENGHFCFKQMEGGHYTIQEILEPPLIGMWATRRVPYTLEAGAHKTGLKLTLLKGAIITGHVSYRGSNKVAAGVGVSATTHVGIEYNSGTYASTDASGNYRLCVVGGNIDMYARSGHSIGVSQYVTAKTGETRTVNFTIDSPLPDAVVKGIVTDQAGRPVEGAVVEGSLVNAHMAPETHTGPDGKFSLSFSDSPMIFLCAHKGDSVTVKDTAAVNGDNVTLKLQDNVLVAINGKVLDPDGKPIAGARVTPLQWHGQSGMSMDSGVDTTDASGAYHVSSLPPGFSYSVQVDAKGFGAGEATGLQPEPGATLAAADIVLPRLDSHVAGHIVDSHGFPLANAKVTLVNDRNRQVTTDKLGAFRFTDIAAGNLPVQVSAGDEYTTVLITAGKDDTVIRTHSMTADQKEMAAQPKPEDFVGKYAPEFNVLNWVNVSPIAMSDLKGTIVIFDMWSCCSDSLSQLQQLAQQFGSRGVVAIGLNVTNSSVQDVQAHIAQEKLTLPMAIDKVTYGGLGGAAGDFTIVGRDGKIAYVGFGFDPTLAALTRILAR